MTPPKTLSEFSTLAAEKFIQTVVFVDDKIYNTKSGSVLQPKVAMKPTTRKAALKSSTSAMLSKSVDPDEETEIDDFSTHDIVSSFAKKSIVCSLYQPREGASVSGTSDIYKLCLASDIVILDWDLGDAGKKTLELVSNLVVQSLEAVPEQLRLILIYTNEPNLIAVAEQIYDRLSTLLKGKVVPQKEDLGLALHTSNSRVVILGKPGHRLPKFNAYTENERSLAERSITEFAKLASGLLQSAVLLGLAEIRGNSRKILSKFDSTLDPAFLTHRALSLPDEEASNHVVPLLVAELQSILEDCLPSPVISSSVIKNWCADKWEPGPHVRSLLKTTMDEKAFASDLCLTGPQIKETYPSETELKKLANNGLWKFGNDESFAKLSTFLHPSKDSKENQNLSILMSQRTYYNTVPRVLTLGTIVRFDGHTGTQYLLCLHPLCDSVRLESKRKFVFCSLAIRNPENGVKKTSHVVFDNDQFIELFFSPKSFNCVTKEFEPDNRVKKVIATSNEGALGFTSCCDNKRYAWVSQLKPDHAQRAVEQFARELSRVGLTESEWLRLMAK